MSWARHEDAGPAARPPQRPTGTTLITGGAGFIGTNLAARLAAEGRRVIILDNLSRAGVEANANFLLRRYPDQIDLRAEDVRNRTVLRACLAEAEDVFHFAAQVAVTTSLVSPEEDFEINAGGTVLVLEEVRRLGRPCPLLYTSTNKVYGCLPDVELINDGERYRPADPALAESGICEERALTFCSPYGCSKGCADQYVLDYARSFGLLTCVFRMSCIYGPHQCGNEDQGWVAHFLKAAAAGETITLYGNGRQVRDVLFVEDLIDAMRAARNAIGSISGRAFNIGGGPANTVSLVELLEMIAELQGEPVRTNLSDWRVGDQRWYVSGTGAFTAATGWSPKVSVREGVGRLHQWLGCRARAGAFEANVRTSEQ